MLLFNNSFKSHFTIILCNLLLQIISIKTCLQKRHKTRSGMSSTKLMILLLSKQKYQFHKQIVRHSRLDSSPCQSRFVLLQPKYIIITSFPYTPFLAHHSMVQIFFLLFFFHCLHVIEDLLLLFCCRVFCDFFSLVFWRILR